MQYKDQRTGDNASSAAYVTTCSYDSQGNLTPETTPPTAEFPNGRTAKSA